jgi:hypothetical protein
MIEQLEALTDSQRGASAPSSLAGRASLEQQRNLSGRGCVEATDASTRVSTAVDEGTPIRAQFDQAPLH